MYDSIDLSQIPSNPPAVAGYVGGFWPDFSPEVKAFPNAHHLSIAVTSAEDADCLDIENGDAVPGDAPAWFKRQKARGVARPCFYSDLFEAPSVVNALSSAGIKRDQYRLWIAHYTDVSHIEPGADATQWTDRALGRNLDESTCSDTFFTTPTPDPAPKPVFNPTHYDRFPTGPFRWHGVPVNERLTVKKYDNARRRPLVNAIRLRVWLRPRCLWLANRVAHEAISQPRPNGRPSWGEFHRGYRYQQLIGRARGRRFV